MDESENLLLNIRNVVERGMRLISRTLMFRFTATTAKTVNRTVSDELR